MQYIEASVIGIRSAVITLKRRATPLSFVVFPMVHVGEPEFFRQVAEMARECDLIIAEGVPSGTTPAQEWMSKQRWDHLVDQITALDLEGLGVPVQWEYVPDGQQKTNRERAVQQATDAAAAVALRLLGRYGSPLGLPSLDQSDEHDDRWEWRSAPSWVARFIHANVVDVRDSRLVESLAAIHRERCDQPGKVAVVFGAGHVPAVIDCLTERLGYYVANARWLTVANAPC